MSAGHERHLVRGAMVVILSGLAASWVMNEFMAGPGKTLERSIREHEPLQKHEKNTEEEDSTMKAADAIVEITSGGRHLSREGREKGGAIVHYAFGGLMGGVYGCFAEYYKTSRAGLGTIFGALLFIAGDLIAVPALQLSEPPTQQPVSALINPFAAHLVYGSTTELVRRTLRAVSQ